MNRNDATLYAAVVFVQWAIDLRTQFVPEGWS
jgi:hypothetical protein